MLKSTPTAEGGGNGAGVGGCGEVGGGRGAGGEGGEGPSLAAMEYGSAAGRRSVKAPLESRRDVRSSRRVAAGSGDGAGVTDEDEESLNRHFSLETPLQQVRARL